MSELCLCVLCRAATTGCEVLGQNMRIELALKIFQYLLSYPVLAGAGAAPVGSAPASASN